MIGVFIRVSLEARDEEYSREVSKFFQLPCFPSESCWAVELPMECQILMDGPNDKLGIWDAQNNLLHCWGRGEVSDEVLKFDIRKQVDEHIELLIKEHGWNDEKIATGEKECVVLFHCSDCDPECEDHRFFAGHCTQCGKKLSQKRLHRCKNNDCKHITWSPKDKFCGGCGERLPTPEPT